MSFFDRLLSPFRMPKGAAPIPTAPKAPIQSPHKARPGAVPPDIEAAARHLHEFLTASSESSVPSFVQRFLASEESQSIQALYESACECGRNGDMRKACDLLLDICRLEEKVLRELFRLANEDQRLWLAGRARVTLSALLSVIVCQPAREASLLVRVLESVLRRKALTHEAASMTVAAARRGDNPQLLRLFDQLRKQRDVIANETMEGVRRAETAFLKNRIVGRLKQRRDQLELEIASQVPYPDLVNSIAAVSVRDIALALPDGAVLIEYVQFSGFSFEQESPIPDGSPDRLMAFILDKEAPDRVSLVDLGDAIEAEEMIRKWLASLSTLHAQPAYWPSTDSGGKRTQNGDLGDRLRERLFDPLSGLVGNRLRLIIAQDGALSLLPFEALPLNNGTYLIDRFDISYVTTGRDVLRWRDQAPNLNGDFVIGGPDFDLGLEPGERGRSSSVAVKSEEWYRPVHLKMSLDFAPLPGAEREARLVAAALGTQAWVGPDALKGRLKAECHSPRILHIATHGFFLRTNDPTIGESWSEVKDRASMGGPVRPAHVPRFDEVWQHGPVSYGVPGLDDPTTRSGLALAGARTWLRLGSPPPEADNGLFTAQDALNLDLLDTELVVLSGCETATGDLIPGEGVLGMRRSFLVAGAQTVIASCWGVADEVTEQMMLHFYRNLLHGMGRAQALNSARTMIRKGHPEPFYWGAFICLGNPYPMSAVHEPA